MEIREQSKIVELWLTREERDDPAFRESLKPIYQPYKDQKYLVAVFLSPERRICTSRPGTCCSTTAGGWQRRKSRRRSRPGW